MLNDDILQAFYWAKLNAPLFNSPIHGKKHWLDVRKNGLKLVELTPGADPVVVELFAYLHDFRRLKENNDFNHGIRAAKYISKIRKNILIKLTDKQFASLQFAIQNHCGGDPVNDPTVGCCYDSDRLDLYRVGLLPRKIYMSTEAAKRLCEA